MLTTKKDKYLKMSLFLLLALGLLALPGLVQAASYWLIETVDSDAVVGRHNALALDSSGYPHIS